MKLQSMIAILALFVLVAGCASEQTDTMPPAQTAPEPEPATVEPAPVTPSAGVEWVSVPEKVMLGKLAELLWKVNGEVSVQTGLVYGTKSKANITELTLATYSSKSPKAALSGTAPAEFKATLNMGDPIVLYVRAYATIGEMTYWTEEKAVEFTP